MKTINEEEFIEICKNSQTAAEAARKLNMHFNTFKRYAVKLNCYFTNQSHKGMQLGHKSTRIQTWDILDGKYPNYSTFKLKQRLLEEGIKKDECELCGWHEKRTGEFYTPCELHHKDGNPHNHLLANLIILCPNCHSLTDNYRSKNRATLSKDKDGMQANSSNTVVNEELSEDN